MVFLVDKQVSFFQAIALSTELFIFLVHTQKYLDSSKIYLNIRDNGFVVLSTLHLLQTTNDNTRYLKIDLRAVLSMPTVSVRFVGIANFVAAGEQANFSEPQLTGKLQTRRCPFSKRNVSTSSSVKLRDSSQTEEASLGVQNNNVSPLALRAENRLLHMSMLKIRLKNRYPQVQTCPLS